MTTDERLRQLVTEWLEAPEPTETADIRAGALEMLRAAELQVDELRKALYSLLRFSTKPQPRDEEEQEQVVAKVAKALKSAGKLDESEDTVKQKCEVCHGKDRPECAGSSGCYCGCHAEVQS